MGMSLRLNAYGLEGVPVANENMNSLWSLVDEGKDHFMIQNNQTGQQQAVAKAATPEPLHEEIRALPKLNLSPQTQAVAQKEWSDTEPARQASEAPATEPPPVAGKEPAPAVQPVAAVPPPIDPNLPWAMDLARFQKESSAALAGAAQAQSQGAANSAQINADLAQRMQAESDAYNQHRKELDDKTNALTQDVANTKIDPNHWWDQQTGASGFGKRVVAFLGMVLGGPMQLKTGVNPMQHALDKLINDDLDAQKENLNTKKGILGDYFKQYGNLDMAHRAAYVDMASMANAQLSKIAAETQSQVVKQNAQLAISQNNLQIAEKKHELAAQAAMMGAINRVGGGSPTGQDFNYLPKEYQERVVTLPNGKTTLANTKDDADALKKAQENIGTIKSIIDQMREHVKGPSVRSALPDVLGLGSVTETGEKGENLQTQAMNELRGLGQALRISEFTSDSFLKKMVPNVSQWKQDQVKNKIDSLDAYVTDKLNKVYANRTIGHNPDVAASKANVKKGLQ